jgi:hypothetical protein
MRLGRSPSRDSHLAWAIFWGWRDLRGNNAAQWDQWDTAEDPRRANGFRGESTASSFPFSFNDVIKRGLSPRQWSFKDIAYPGDRSGIRSQEGRKGERRIQEERRKRRKRKRREKRRGRGRSPR